MNPNKTFLTTLRWVFGITLVFWGGAFYQGYQLAHALKVSWGSPKWMTALIIGGAGVVILITLLALTWSPVATRFVDWLTRGGRWLARHRPWHLPWMILFAGVFPLLLMPAYAAPVGELLNTFFWRAFPFWLVTVAGAVLLQTRYPQNAWWYSVGVAGLGYGVAYRIAAFLPDISTYPFSLTWSEASRYYYASLFYSDTLYDVHANPSVLHPTRYWLQSLPFLMEGLPLWVHRMWQVFLWVATNGLAAGLVVKRISRGEAGRPSLLNGLGKNEFKVLYVGFWAFLFLFQGPIWYHLVVMIILVLWGTDTSRFWKTLIVVLVASAWGGVSRINWIPFPAALAGMIYLLEHPKGTMPLWRYLLPPVAWGGVGVVAGLLAQAGYVQWSGNSAEQFASAFSSDLLWYRLFPSATYPLGVVPATLLASLPVLWLGWRLQGIQVGERPPAWFQMIHPIRWVGVAGVIGVFFAGGLVVSAKIGGGSNLHNMDAYLALLVVAAVYVLFGKVQFEPLSEGTLKPNPSAPFPWLILALAVLIPIKFALDVGRSYDYDFIPKPKAVREALEDLQSMVAEATANGGEVLLISERQLLTFGSLEAPLVDAYEKVFLMEMAMSGNPDYLGQFEEDLRNHRFALIITVPVQANIQDEEDIFGEENNAWVEHVNYPLACFYEQKLRLRDVRIEVLEPRDGVECPAPEDN